MRGSFAEDMFNHSPSVILRDDILEGLVGNGCGRKKGGVGNVLGNLLRHNDVSFTEFLMEEFSHRR